ncbi:MAG: hypothetical protein K5892_01115 [Acholeplasmatales bacterium]|nr:hypothetical protein [Acholeplasmatales bacterium]
MDFDKLKNDYMKCYGISENVKTSYCPYRICPLGAHVDHQHGLVTGFAINYGVGIAYTINDDGFMQLTSTAFPQKIRFYIDVFMERKGNWADYLIGACKALQKNGYILKYGINAYINGEMPIGGISSSSAVIIAFLRAISKANHFYLTDKQLIEYAYDSEVNYMHLAVGLLDPSCQVLAKQNELLVLDTQNMKYELIKTKADQSTFEFLLIHCGMTRTLEPKKYNLRVDECKAAAFTIQAYEGVVTRLYKDTTLRDIPYDVFKKYEDKIPFSFRKRCIHFFGENERVEKGKLAWQNGDMVEFGKLVSESGASSIQNYDTASPLLTDIYNLLIEIDGVYGTRFMGGGFNGSCLAIIEKKKEDNIKKTLTEKYLKMHPEFEETFKIYTINSVDGVGE